jgi:DNA polymerase-3 subunit epsilon
VLWALAALGAGVLSLKAWRRYGAAPARLAESVLLSVATPTPFDPEAAAGSGPSGMQALAQGVGALVAQRDLLRRDMAAQVAQASQAVALERTRLAALMAELAQSVVVCNLDGRVLLFNAQARLQFQALSPSAPIGGAEVIGLGRSIYNVLDRRLVDHALQAVVQRLQRGEAHPCAQFVTTTPGGQLLRVQMAPVRADGPATAQPAGPELNGFVLLLEDITTQMADEGERDRLLHRLTEGQRGSLGNLQAAVELLQEPDLDGPLRERFLGIVREEAAAMATRLNDAAAQGLRALVTRWPLEDMLGTDLLAAAASKMESGLKARVIFSDADPQIWLKVDSYSLIQVLLHLAGRLSGEYGIQRLQLRLHGAADKAQLDLVWAVQAMSTETVTAWETEPLQADGQSSGLTVRDVVERHGGALWFERARARQEAFFRFLLPRAAEATPWQPATASAAAGVGRPEFYDFDLFAHADPAADEAQRPLSALSYTVFDTETTGLSPAEGDEIIQIGATRIVAGKLRRQECFEQLIDPKRPLSEAGILIHGIEPQMLVGQPDIAQVLPVFHRFAADTVLVAHNAAFDMRFLQLKEASTGLRFDQPVLDTLLLSAVLHPQQGSHRLEAIAERLGVPLLGRHTALGDAMVTAEIFVRMLPLLQAQGITTLGQAVDAARRTYLARVSY